MAKNRYARYKFQVRKNQVVCIGQRQTRRGVNYNAETVRIPVEGRTAADLKAAMALGIAELDNDD